MAGRSSRSFCPNRASQCGPACSGEEVRGQRSDPLTARSRCIGTLPAGEISNPSHRFTQIDTDSVSPSVFICDHLWPIRTPQWRLAAKKLKKRKIRIAFVCLLGLFAANPQFAIRNHGQCQAGRLPRRPGRSHSPIRNPQSAIRNRVLPWVRTVMAGHRFWLKAAWAYFSFSRRRARSSGSRPAGSGFHSASLVRQRAVSHADRSSATGGGCTEP